uniref:Mitotic spindle assembly checkpoint protein MAD1 n=1 Tax=Ditylenchus dipsaci TaxID=166011 RepID=A0A915ELK2_9BILA
MYASHTSNNDESRIFENEVQNQYRKDFGRGRSNQKTGNDLKTNELNIQVIEVSEENARLKRSLDTKDREIERLERLLKTSTSKISNLTSQNQSCKAELERIKRSSRDFGDDKLKEKLLLDNYRTALSKYVTWYTYAEKQMAVMKDYFINECGGWNEQIRYKIYFSYKEVEPITVTDDEVTDLCKPSVLEYQGIEEIENISDFEQRLKFHNISTQTETDDNNTHLESGFIHHSEEADQFLQSGSNLQTSRPAPFMTADEIRTLEQTAKIQSLESENVHIKNQLTVLSGKAKHNTLLEEQKNDLQNQMEFLKAQNSRIIAEHEELKEILNVKLGSADLLQKLTDAKQHNSELENKIKELESQKPDSKKIAQFMKEQYQKRIDQLESQLAEFIRPHNSDTTRILRFRGCNPLDEAYEDHMVNQAAQAASSHNTSKRRKLDSSNSADEYSANTTEDNSEEVQDLRRELKRLNKEYETASNVQKELALQYRQIVTLLTGYQVKMREEGFCEVGNVLDQGGVFLFQRREDNGVDLLDNDCAQRWKPIVENYLAKYNSVPAFLAAVNLSLMDTDASFNSTFFNITKA